MSLKDDLESLSDDFAAAAQKVYDAWDQDEDGMDDVLGSGGICDQVADAISDVIYTKLRGVDVIDGGQDGDDHAFIYAYDDEDAYAVDIPPGVYEQGSGYSWKKIPDVTITADDVSIYKVNRRDIVGDDE